MKQFNNLTIQQLDQRGFTLIELMVSIAIVGILSSVVMANTRFGSRQQDLTRAAQKLAFDIRKSQNAALAPGAESHCIYGMVVRTKSRYILYRRSDSQCGNDGMYKYVNGLSTRLEIINLDKNIRFTVVSDRDAAFEAPEPITYINGATTTAEVQIELFSSAINMSKKVIVNRLGQVEIQ